MTVWQRIGNGAKRVGYLVRAAPWAIVLGTIETLRSERGRRLLAVLALGGITVGLVKAPPLRTIAPGEAGVRENRLTGGQTAVAQGWVMMVPGLHDLRRYPLRDQIYKPHGSAKHDGATPFQSVEGLPIGVDVTVRYALDPDKILTAARTLPDNLGEVLVEPVVDGVLHRIFAQHTVREIFASKRAEIQKLIEAELAAALVKDGVVLRTVYLGNVDLPADYRKGLEGLLAEELSAEKMRFTLELREKQVKETELQAEAEKVKREKGAEAAGNEEIIAAKAKAEAMKHVLPFKEKEIEQKRLEAEAAKVTRMKLAEGEAEARRIESSGEADARRKLADSDAYRIEAMGKASSEQLARESALISKNPLLIQKTLADKLSDKIQVIIAPPNTGGGFIAGNLLGGNLDGKSDKKTNKDDSSDDKDER